MNKRVLSVLSAAVIAAAASVTAFAEDTTIHPKGGDPFNVTPDPSSAVSAVELNIDPSYTVVIPEKFVLTGTYGTKCTGSGELSATDVRLEEKNVIEVSVSAVSGFNMKTSAASEYNLPYTVTGSEGAVTDKTNGGVVAEFAIKDGEQKQELTFETDEVPKYAGSYSDTVTFNIRVAQPN